MWWKHRTIISGRVCSAPGCVIYVHKLKREAFLQTWNYCQRFCDLTWTQDMCCVLNGTSGHDKITDTSILSIFVPRRNEVAEGGYWIALRLSVCPSVSPSVRLSVRPSVRPASITFKVLVRIHTLPSLFSRLIVWFPGSAVCIHVSDTGRWTHFNIKLHFFFFLCWECVDQLVV